MGSLCALVDPSHAHRGHRCMHEMLHTRVHCHSVLFKSNMSLCRDLWQLQSIGFDRASTFMGRSSPEEEVCRQTPRSAAPSRHG